MPRRGPGRRPVLEDIADAAQRTACRVPAGQGGRQTPRRRAGPRRLTDPPLVVGPTLPASPQLPATLPLPTRPPLLGTSPHPLSTGRSPPHHPVGHVGRPARSSARTLGAPHAAAHSPRRRHQPAPASTAGGGEGGHNTGCVRGAAPAAASTATATRRAPQRNTHRHTRTPSGGSPPRRAVAPARRQRAAPTWRSRWVLPASCRPCRAGGVPTPVQAARAERVAPTAVRRPHPPPKVVWPLFFLVHPVCPSRCTVCPGELSSHWEALACGFPGRHHRRPLRAEPGGRQACPLSLSRGLPAHPFLARYSGGTMDANFATISSFHQWGRGNRVPGPPDVAHLTLAHWQHTRRDYFPWTWRGRKGEGGSLPPPLSPTHRAPLPPPPATRRPRGRR